MNLCHLLLRTDLLESELFQHHDYDTNYQKPKQTASWTSCTYLSLYNHIQRHLGLARKCLYDNVGEQSVNSDRAYMLLAKYFMGKVARALIANAHNGDPPFVWKTTKSNRKKDIGTYVIVDGQRIERSIDTLVLQLRKQCNSVIGPVMNSSPAQHDILNKMSLLRSLSHENLHRILMGIPYKLLIMKGHEGGCLRPGYYLSFAHVLIVSILSLFTVYDGGEGGNWWNGILGVDPHSVYKNLHSPDPLSSISSCSNIATALFQVRNTNIHLLWDNSQSFVKSVMKIKDAIKSRLSKKRMKCTGSLNALSTKEPFKLDELRMAVESFSFISNRQTLGEMLESGNGNFDGINAQIVVQLKTFCSCFFVLENRYIRHKASRIGTRAKKAKSKKEMILNLLRRCHEQKYIKLASDDKQQRDESNFT